MAAVTLERVDRDAKPILARLLQLYLYDFTEFEPAAIGEDGAYAYRYLDEYWDPAPGEQRHAYFIRSDGALAGFAMVRVVNRVNVMSEFFVLRPERRAGVGRRAAAAVIRSHTGDWVIHEHPANEPAKAFWRGVSATVTGGKFDEVVEPDGAVTQRFTI